MPGWGLVQGSLCIAAVAAAVVVASLLIRRLAGPRGIGWGPVLLVCLVAGGGLWFAEICAESERRALQQQVQGLAPTLAYSMERGLHEHVKSDTSPDDPVYLALVDRQRRLQEINRGAIADIYTFRPNAAGELCLIVDAETDYDGDGLYSGEREMRTPIGEVFGPIAEAERRALAGETVFADEVFTDRWGTWVSAYAPIRNSRGGVDAVLGVDFPAADWIKHINAARREAYALVVIFTTIILAVTVIVRMQRATMERLREAASRAEEGVRAKSQFLANISHEIRTPMTAIMGYADLLLDPGMSEADRLAAMSTIKRAGEHLLSIVNDLLDLSKLEAERLAVEYIEVSPLALVAEVESLMRPRAEGKGVRLATEFVGPMPRTITSDPLRLRQILLNLVGNAIKFTEVGSVSIVARMAASVVDRAPLFAVEVRDTGIGMSPDQMERLFLPFVQADASTTRQFGGTGLGLMISRRLAWLLGGEISVTSEPGVGSSFLLMVSAGDLDGVEFIAEPGAVAARRFELPPETAPPTALRGRILLVEDGPDNQRLIAFHLRRAGATVEIASSGREAVERALESDRDADPYDLILMDMQMPEMDGYEATSTLRRAGYRVPIVALTANAMAQDREKCLLAGCDDFATKPIEAIRLVQLCARYTGAARAAA